MASKFETSEKIEETSVTPPHSNSAYGEDEVAAEAIGGTNSDLPKGYYRSPSFIGTVLVST